MQADPQQQQQNQQYQYPTQQQSPQLTDYSPNGTPTIRSNGHTNGAMNPYQQYSAGYGQQQQQAPPYPLPQQQQQHQQPQQQMQQRPFMPNQLPPLGQAMAPPMPYSMPPVRESPDPRSTGPANSAQPSAYSAAASQQASQQSLPPPASRAGTSAQPQEKKMFNSSTRDGHRYSLEVVQQPQRARMCGFGDKDRRPITPPPCVRLVIIDIATEREIDVNDITSDPSFFVLQVDLWAESADREANVVRASSNSPAVSISSATTTSYPPPAEHPRQVEQPVMYLGQDGHMYAGSVPGYPVPLVRPGQGMYAQHPGSMYYPSISGQGISYMPPAQSNSAMYTRNLIGSLTVNASRLTDNEGKAGYWFVLQDLSVRTEGFFRLRMSFIDISNHGAPGVNRGKAPVLAWTFSDKFQVYSAKKFPGVIESTPLSKCFASQGIKIPIRKDNKGDGGDDDDAG